MRWQTFRKEYIYKSQWLTVRKDAVKLPSGVELNDFYVLEYPDWIVVIVHTKNDKYLIEKQYRHGIDRECFELCAGVVEPNEDPLEAAKRELLEETGYTANSWTALSNSAPNASAMTNLCHCFVAEDAKKTSESNCDLSEDIEICEVSESELIQLLKEGKIIEASMRSAIWEYLYTNNKK